MSLRPLSPTLFGLAFSRIGGFRKRGCVGFFFVATVFFAFFAVFGEIGFFAIFRFDAVFEIDLDDDDCGTWEILIGFCDGIESTSSSNLVRTGLNSCDVFD